MFYIIHNDILFESKEVPVDLVIKSFLYFLHVFSVNWVEPLVCDFCLIMFFMLMNAERRHTTVR